MANVELMLIRQSEGGAYWVIEPNVNENYYTELERKEFVIPEGFSVLKTQMDEIAFFDEKDCYCDLLTNKKICRPYLVTSKGNVYLKDAENIFSEIKELRKAVNFTQQEFADYFGVSRRTLENWECGRAEQPKYLLKLLEYKLRNEGLLK